MGGERLLVKNNSWKGSKDQRHARQNHREQSQKLHTEVQRVKWSSNTSETVRHTHVHSNRFSSYP